MELRRLNARGIGVMESFLDSLTSPHPETYPPFRLDDPGMTEVIDAEITVEEQQFGSRLEAASHLYKLLADAPLDDVSIDRGLWAWLALFYFEASCPTGRGGKRVPGARARWIPEVFDHKRYYRHLLAGPYLIYRAHADEPERALAVLCGPVDRPGDVVEQLASRMELVSNPGFMGAATLLYVDPETRRPKRGAGGKGPGSPRRLAVIHGQFDLTWDLYSLTREEFVEMLPEEFFRFLPSR